MEQKNKKIFGGKTIILTAIIAVMYLITVLVLGLNLNNGKRIIGIDPELARAMTYEQYGKGEEVVDGTNKCVEFSAFFLRDLNGDGIAEKIKGTCKEIGEEDVLYLEVKVLTEGTLKDAVIDIGSNNFYYNTAIVKDNHVKTNCISANTKTIELNNLESGTQKLLLGNVRTGDYSEKTKRLEALENDINKYSATNKVTLTGTYVNNGVEKEITKEIDLTVDWYGKTECKIPDSYKYDENVRNVEIYLGPTKPEQIKVEFTIPVQETANELLLSKSYIEGTIPVLNGYKPTNVKITGTNIQYTYDEETMKYTAWRDAKLDENGKITSNAYSTVYDNEIYNEYNFTIEYPVDVYDAIQEEVTINMPITAYYEGYNNENEEFGRIYKSNVVKDNINITLETIERSKPTVFTWLGELKSKPDWRRIISKQKPTEIYNGRNVEEKDYYLEEWKLNTGKDGQKSGIIIKDTQNLLPGENQVSKTNEFIYANNTTEEMGDIVKYVGLYFKDTTAYAIGPDGWLKIYNDVTNELIKEFTYKEIMEFAQNNPYYYSEGISHIRVETSSTRIQSAIQVINIKEIDDEKLVKRYTKDRFDEISAIRGYIVGYANYGTNGIDDIRNIGTNVNEAIYENKLSVAEIEVNPTSITTQSTAENQIIIKAIRDEENNEYAWVNGTFLVKLPKEIIDLKVKNVRVNDRDVKIDSHEVYEKEGNYYIKIHTATTKETEFSITIDCEISANPIMTSINTQVELYAVNSRGAYFYKAEDIYDVNNNGNTKELINHTIGEINIVSPSSLLTSTIASEYDSKNSTAIAPRIAHVDKEQREAKVSLNLINNYAAAISDIVVTGKIPFRENSYILNGKDLGSEFTVSMQNSGLEIPLELQPYAKIYYSAKENPTKDIADQENGWVTKESVTEWNDIKSYIVVLENFEMPENNNYVISYKITIPEGLNYNDVTYCTHAVYFSLNTDEGKYKTSIESNKLGIMVAKQYDLELTKYQINLDKKVSGATYSVKDVETGESKTAVTDEFGKLLITGLYAEKEYKIKEIKSPTEYALNEEEITIRTNTDENDNLQVNIESGRARNINVVKEEGKDWKVTIEVEDEPKAKVEILSKDKVTGMSLSGVQFNITGRDKLGGILTTNEEGKVTSEGLYLEGEYTLEQTKANGYFINTPVKFRINRSIDVGASSARPLEEQYTHTITEGTVKNSELVYENGIPVLKLEIENEPRDVYTLEIIKVEKDQIETSIVGAKFEIAGPGMDRPRSFVTGENGEAEIDKLYIGEDETEAVEYTLTETEAPAGYIKINPITFKVYREGDSLVYKNIEGQVKETNIEGQKVSLIIEDEPVFKLVKKDGETLELLPNVKFALYSIDIETKEETFAKNTRGETIGELETIKGKEYRVLTTDENGQIRADLGDGLYKVVELETLEQYELPEEIEERSYYFGIGNTRAGEVKLTDEWYTTIESEKNFTISNMIQTSDKGYLVNGHFGAPTLTLTKKDGTKIELRNSGSNNCFIIKYNENREIEWADSMGKSGTSDTGYNKIIETIDGYILAGTSVGNPVDLTLSNGTVLNQKGQGDIIIVKYGKNGNILWSDCIGGTGDDRLYAITPTEDGGVALGCKFSNGTTITSQTTNKEFTVNKNNSNMIKYDKDGNIVLNLGVLDYSYGYIYGIQETKDNGYLIMSTFSNNMTLPNGDEITHKGGNDIIVAKYDSKGNMIWYDTIGGNKTEGYTYNLKNAIIKAKDGGYFVVGEFQSDSIILSNGDEIYSAGSKSQNFIIKYNEDGKIEWSKQLNNIQAMSPTDDGGFVLIRHSDNRLEKYDKNGEKEWVATEDKWGSFYAYAVLEKSKGKYILGGMFTRDLTLPSGETITADSTHQKAIIAEYDVEITPEVENLGNVNTIPEQITYNPIVAEYIGGSAWDSHVRSIGNTSDGGYVVSQGVMSKETKITLKDGTEKVLTNKGSRWNNILVKYDKDGDATWATIVGGTAGDDQIFDVKGTDDGGFIAVGEYGSTDIVLGGDINIGKTDGSDGIIIKYDAEGNVQWYDTIGGTSYQGLISVAQVEDGYIAIGDVTGTVKITGGDEFTANGYDVVIIKYDNNGNISWYKKVEGMKDQKVHLAPEYIPTILDKTSDNGFIFGINSNNGNANLDSKYLTFMGAGLTSDYVGGVVKCNNDGTLNWSSIISGFSEITGVSETNDGGYAVSASYKQNIVLSNGDVIVNKSGTNNGILIKYNKDGKIEWHREITGEKEVRLYSSKGLNNGDIVVVGDFNDKVTLHDNTVITSSWETVDGLVLIYDENGNLKWTYASLQAWNDGIYTVDEISDNRIVFGGYAGYDLGNLNSIVKNTKPGDQDGYIATFKRGQLSKEIPGKLELTVMNTKKEYKIQTNVKAVDGIKGGSISGQTEFVYETVKHGAANTKEIVMTPEANYEVISIKINGKEIVGAGLALPGENGTYTIPVSAFAGITEDKQIEVTYGLSSNKITIEKVDRRDNTKKLEGAKLRLERITSEDDTEEYEIELTTNAMGQATASIPYGTYKVTELEAPVGYKINEAIENIEFTEGGTQTFLVEDGIKPSVVVHHYLKDREGNITETKVAEDEITYGEPGENYSTLPKLNLEGYELEKDSSGEYIIPENATGIYGEEGQTIVTYYYKQKQIPLTVHYYIGGTEERVPLVTGEKAEDVIIQGYEGESYETVALENMHEKYELVETPVNAEGTYGKEGITVIYYYRIKTYNIRTQIIEKEETNNLGEVTKVKGGRITGERESVYEEVEHGDTTTKEITITPDENYRIKTVMINGTPIYDAYGTSTTSENGDTSETTENPETTQTENPDGVGAHSVRPQEDGTLTLAPIENVTEDKVVTVEFEKKKGTVTVHHYIQGTTTKVPGKEEGTEVQDEIKTGYIGSIYATKEKTSEEISESYMYVRAEGNTSGTYEEGNQEVTYYYVTREASIIVHHYIYNREEETESNRYTKKKLVEDVITEGKVGEEYETTKSSEIPLNYRCIKEDPENYTGKMKEGQIEISYYYELIEPTLEDEIEITATASEIDEEGTAILTKERGTVTYNIKYTAKIKDYKGKVKIDLVNTLPSGIDTDKSSLANGTYDNDKHEIKWVENIEEIDTFAHINTETKTRATKKGVGASIARPRETSETLETIPTPEITYAQDGTCTIEITKQIEVVYENQDVIRNLNSKVEGKTTIYYPENYITEKAGEEQKQESKEARVEVKQDYKVHFKVVKIWDDNNNIKGKRPESITVEIRVMPNDKAIEKELNAANNWTYEETVLPKYNGVTGEKIKYVVTEKETNVGDLEYYNLVGIQEAETEVEQITNYTYTITNAYKLMETNLSTNLTMTGTEEIVNKGDKIDYTIHLTGEVKDYIGEGIVKIVDTLPYRIDETKENELAGGIYDKENKTITWEIDLPHINTKGTTGEETEEGNGEETDIPYTIDITKQISIVYEDINLEEEKITNGVKGTIELYDAEEKQEKTAEAETLIKVQGKVIVKYVDIETDKEITKEDGKTTYRYEITGKVGKEYKAEEKDIDKYIYVRAVNEEGKIKEKEQEAIFYYKTARTKVIIKYQDTEGNEIKEDEVIEGYVGDDYKTEQKEIENYKYVEVKGTEEGKMTEETIIITYVYEKEGKIVVKYIDIDTEEELEEYGYEINGKIEDEYETEEKKIPYYVYEKDSGNTKGKIEKEVEVTYYYRKQNFNFSVEKTISSITLNGEKVKISDNKLAKIEVKEKEIGNTELIIKYNIKVTNEGELGGTAKIKEILPKGYELVEEGLSSSRMERGKGRKPRSRSRSRARRK